ncbi:MAG: FeoB-associated Cys-rich membrane protein [Clostridia bacterium]|nr:FeoB-associated Cys-rich membrane protein [Clostridia bacterium]
MLDFLQANLGTIAVGAILAIILVAAFLKIRKDKKNGGGCGCGCSGCPSAGMCHGSKEQQENKD